MAYISVAHATISELRVLVQEKREIDGEVPIKASRGGHMGRGNAESTCRPSNAGRCSGIESNPLAVGEGP